MFTHLHVHTEFSLLDGLPKIKKLIPQAKELGMQSLGISDHGVMYGAHKFHKECQKEDIKPIIGCEVYVAPRKHTQKIAKLDEKPHHLVLIAENRKGYDNLIKLVSKSHIDGFYYKPRIDKELLEKHKDGLIALSGCLTGEISKKVFGGDLKDAHNIAQWYKELFGKDRFYVELQRNGMKDQEVANKGLIQVAEDLELPLIATCDVHYIKEEDALAQEVLMCINTGKRLEDEQRLTRETDEFYLKSPEQMEELFQDIPEAIENTQKVTDMCEVFDLGFEDWVFPEPPIPDSYKKDYDKYLYDLIKQRAPKVINRELTKDEKKRAEYEFEVISEMGYSSYIVMNMDFTDWIKNNNIPFTTRGSAAGSFVSYILGIVTANPLDFQVPFERFLYKGRPSAPDIDIDVASSRREEVINYAIDLYGKESVAHIVTFGRMQARGSIRDAGRVLGLPLAYVDRIAKLIPPSGQGLAKVDIDRALREVPELKELTKQDPDAAKLIDTAKKIEGVAKSQGIHACGILVTPGPIVDYCPVIWDKTLGEDGRMITQYEMDSLEELKLLKVDFLGLTGLDTISESVKIIKEERGIDIDPTKFPLDDEATYKLIKDLDTLGVFQLETGPMKNTAKVLRPESIFDISASLALVRPGPNQFQQEYADRKSGKKSVTFIDPRMKDFLSLTYGLLVYQEDIMMTTVALAGMTWPEADKARKFTGKKKPEILFDMKDDLLKRFEENGLSEKKAEALFELFIPFTNYAFNKPHAASYALVVFQTAYLKTHYPVEFMAALLKSEIDDFDKISLIIAECNRKGINILPPDVNKSKSGFSIEEKYNIRFGLAAIKNIGESAVRTIINIRDKDGPYKNFDDFLYRIPLNKINQKTISYLVQVGALDNFGERNSLLAALPSMHETYKKRQNSEAEGQIDIFSMGKEEGQTHKITPTPLPQVEPATDTNKIEWEKELLGMYITAHPLGRIKSYLSAIGVKDISEIKQMKPNAHVQACGLITNIKAISTKKENKRMAFLLIEDQTSEIEVILFPSTYEKFSKNLEESTPTIFIGKVNVRDGTRSIICDSLRVIDLDKATKSSDGLSLRIPTNANKDDIKRLKQALKENPGDTPVMISIPDGDDVKTMQLKRGIELTDEVKEIIEPFRIE
ncbi:DNA polymerase III subunit alpha [Candidatus Dojkabacteria bacterium]|nr:DNA polymerase III subunit alpha [Candidatus Dojkabacteria bacterium]